MGLSACQPADKGNARRSTSHTRGLEVAVLHCITVHRCTCPATYDGSCVCTFQGVTAGSSHSPCQAAYRRFSRDSCRWVRCAHMLAIWPLPTTLVHSCHAEVSLQKPRCVCSEIRSETGVNYQGTKLVLLVWSSLSPPSLPPAARSGSCGRSPHLFCHLTVHLCIKTVAPRF